MLSLLIVAILLFATSCSAQNSSTYSVTTIKHKHPLYRWDEVKVTVLNNSRHINWVRWHNKNFTVNGIPADDISPYKVYISLTTVSFRARRVFKSLYSILDGAVLPTKIFLFISKEPFLFDTGFKTIPDELLALVTMKLIHIVFTDNIGPHRKLLPLLAKHYHDTSTVIVTVDDDHGYGPNGNHFLCELLQQFKAADYSSVIGKRMRRMGLCHQPVSRYTMYESWNITNSSMPEMLIVPTGTGGVLYKPSFFHPIVFSDKLRSMTHKTDDLTFRVSCMSNNVTVVQSTLKCPADVSSLIMKKKKKRSDAVTDKELSSGEDRRRLHHLDIDYEDEDDDLKYAIKPHELEGFGMGRRELRHADRGIELWKTNVKEGNDAELQAALSFLKDIDVMPPFTTIIEQFHNEREEICYEAQRYANKANEKSMEIKLMCSMFDCSRSTIIGDDGSSAVYVNTTLA